MNCIHSARSFPSGGRNTNSAITIKIGSRSSRPTTKFLQEATAGAVMSNRLPSTIAWPE